MAQLVGHSIGRYHIVEQLGEGGMAQVYKAYDNRLERYVAVKVIQPNQQQDAMFLKRFEREAKSLAQLSHSNIVKVLDYGDEQGMPYLIMEFISGGTLKQRLGKPLPYYEAARLLAPIANALHYAHQRGIYHRDVKPANILINEAGQPLLSDFGIAKVLETGDQATLTGAGVGIGTPEYMSPEQGLGSTIDGRSDVYSLGVVFFELVTGRRPYRADTPMAVVYKHISDPLPRPIEFVPDLPEAVERVIFKTMAKKPDDRYQDMHAFADALEKLARRDLSFEAEPTLVSPSGAETLVAGSIPAGATVISAGQTRAGVTGPAATQASATVAVAGQPLPAAAGVPKAGKTKLPILIIGGAVVVLLIVVGIFVSQALGKKAQQTGLLAAKSTSTQADLGQANRPPASSTIANQNPASIKETVAIQEQTQPATQPQAATIAPPQVSGDTFSAQSLLAGLGGISSYTINYDRSIKDKAGEQVYTEYYLEESSQDGQLKHIHSSADGLLPGGTGAEAGVYDFYVSAGVTYVYNSDDDTCDMAGTGQEGLIDAAVRRPWKVVGMIQNAQLGDKDVVLDEKATNRYSLEAANLPNAKFDAAKGDVWVAQEGGYVAKFQLSGTDANGSAELNFEIIDVNQTPAPVLPQACSQPQSGSALDIPVPTNATNVSKMGGMVSFNSPDDPSVVANFFKVAMPGKGWTLQMAQGAEQFQMLIFQGANDETLQIMIQPASGGGSTTSVNKVQ